MPGGRNQARRSDPGVSIPEGVEILRAGIFHTPENPFVQANALMA